MDASHTDANTAYAYASSAVPDTLAGAGVQFHPKDLELAAELLGELAYNDTLRAQVIAGQRRRLRDFGDARIREILADLVGSPAACAATESSRQDGVTS